MFDRQVLVPAYPQPRTVRKCSHYLLATRVIQRVLLSAQLDGRSEEAVQEGLELGSVVHVGESGAGAE